ncbi:hypothetical protein AeMF1_011100 [Aphanomyces euteiches]|nr:hypothetical protein AeMF1_011100 [Aphanomyces euteiches]
MACPDQSILSQLKGSTMAETVGTRLFAATTNYLRGKPMLTDDEVKAMYTLKEYVDRIYRYHRRRTSLSSSGRQYFNASNFHPVVNRFSGSGSVSRHSVGLVATHAETESGLATTAIKGILCAVTPFTELSEYDVNTSVFEKLFGQAIGSFWSLHKPVASRLAAITTVWSLLYNSPLQHFLLRFISDTTCRLISMGSIFWLVLYFWSQLNWRMTVTLLRYFDSWFFITQAVLYAVAIMALNGWDFVIVIYNIIGILGFSAVVMYDAYPLSMRNLAKYILLIILICLFVATVSMSVSTGSLDHRLYVDVVHGLVHLDCKVVEDVPLTWTFNVYDFAIQRLQILTIYMVRNTYWAFNAPRYCVIIKSRVALEEVPVLGIRVMAAAQGPMTRRNTLVRQDIELPPTSKRQDSSKSRGSKGNGRPAAVTPFAASMPNTIHEEVPLFPNTGPLYDLHPIDNDAAHVYDGLHRMSIVAGDNKTSTDESISATERFLPAPIPHRPAKPTSMLRLPKLSSQRLRIRSQHLSQFSRRKIIPNIERKTSSVPKNLVALALSDKTSRTGSS